MDRPLKGWLALLAIVLVTPVLVLNGWTLSALWGWFVAPVFGLPALGLAQAIGISTLVRFATYTPRYKVTTVRAFADALLHAVLHPLIVLAGGWIVSRFI